MRVASHIGLPLILLPLHSILLTLLLPLPCIFLPLPSSLTASLLHHPFITMLSMALLGLGSTRKRGDKYTDIYLLMQVYPEPNLELGAFVQSAARGFVPFQPPNPTNGLNLTAIDAAIQCMFQFA